jgi:hypothetical protein
MLYRKIIAVCFADRKLHIFIDLNNLEFSGYNFLIQFPKTSQV